MKSIIITALSLIVFCSAHCQDTTNQFKWNDTTSSVFLSDSPHGFFINEKDSTYWESKIDTINNVGAAFEVTKHDYVRSFHTKYLVRKYKVKVHTGWSIWYGCGDDETKDEVWYDDKKRSHVINYYFTYDTKCNISTLYFVGVVHL